MGGELNMCTWKIISRYAVRVVNHVYTLGTLLIASTNFSVLVAYWI